MFSSKQVQLAPLQGQHQVEALQESIDNLAQIVFDLRVDMQNNNNDTGIGLASVKRQVITS